MQWWQLDSGIGIGAITTKLLDIFWLQDRLERQQRATWLREKRLEAFTEVSKERSSFGLHDGALRSPFQIHGAASRAHALVQLIDQFVVNLERLNRLTDMQQAGFEKEAEEIYQSLCSEAREIIRLPRSTVLRGSSQ